MWTAVAAVAAPARPMSTSTGSGAASSMAPISSGVTTGIMGLPSQGDGDGVGGGVGVGEGEQPLVDAPVGGQVGGLPVEYERGGARVLVPHHLDVGELAGPEADAEGLHHRFLGREPGREALGGVASTLGVG